MRPVNVFGVKFVNLYSVKALVANSDMPDYQTVYLCHGTDGKWYLGTTSQTDIESEGLRFDYLRELQEVGQPTALDKDGVGYHFHRLLVDKRSALKVDLWKELYSYTYLPCNVEYYVFPTCFDKFVPPVSFVDLVK